MQDELMKLLEEIDKAPPGNRLSQGQLKTISRDWYAPDITENFTKILTEQLIDEAYQSDYIRDTNDKSRNHVLPKVQDNTQLFLTIKGFEYLNQIRIKKAIEQLNASIKEFNESSDKTALALIALTIILIILSFIAVSNTPFRILAGGLSILGIVIMISILLKK